MGPGRQRRRPTDRGVVSVLSVFFVLMLLAFLGLAINVGVLVRVRGDLQNAADSAALAAATALDVKVSPGPPFPGRTSADFDRSDSSVQGQADLQARKYDPANAVSQTISLDRSNDLSFGFWHLRAADQCVFSAGGCGLGLEPLPVAIGAANPIQLFAVNAVSVNTRFTVPFVLDRFLGMGPMSLSARATAIGRRARVRCALPFAISVCQLIDDGSGTYTQPFSCPATPITRTFVNGDVSERNAMGRVDLLGRFTFVDQFMRDFARDQAWLQCDDDVAGTTYPIGNGLMPPFPRPNIQPLVDALAGVRGESGVKGDWGSRFPGGHVANRCMLGKPFVLPVVQPSDVHAPADCVSSVWPATNTQSVVGYVNVTFTRINCWHQAGHPDGRPFVQPPLTADNCELELDTDPELHTNYYQAGETGDLPWSGPAFDDLLATNCSGDISQAFANQASLSVVAEISCAAPVGAPATLRASLPARLVK
jgi:hypothetical protein